MPETLDSARPALDSAPPPSAPPRAIHGLVPLLLLCLAGCSDETAPAPAASAALLPSPVLWPEPVAFEPAGALFASHPAAFARISGWVTHLSGPVAERPNVGHRGGFGAGNGHVFGLEGMTDPLNTLHGFVGPTYEKGDRFFGDYAIHLAPPGAAEPPDFDEEWAARSLSAPVLLTRGRLGELVLDTIDFAPATGDPALRSCFVRVLSVSNAGTAESEATELRIVAANDVTSPSAGVLLETTAERSLTTAFADLGGTADAEGLRRTVGPLAPGAEEELVLVHCTAEGASSVAVPAVDPGALLDATAADYAAWEQELVEVDLPDPMMKDFIDGTKMMLRVQTAASGASCPMSQYTRTWARDNIGSTLALLDLGAHDDVRKMMDYVYGAVVEHGDLANSYDADLDLSSLPPAPDFDAMPPLEGRVAAETPSYMVWIYGAHHLATGDLGPAEERLPFLRRCMLAQAFTEEGLLPFTGDETYRTAMDAAFGLPLGFVHEEDTWSANSSLLWLGASRHFVRLAEALGATDDVAAANARFDEVESALLEHYVLDDGCVSPFEDIETGEAWPAPFEDVALTVTWTGYRDGDDPLAQASLACVEKRLKVGPGEYRSLLHEAYTGNLLLNGATSLYTGMVPGYGLSSLCDAGHLEAADAVNFLGRTVGTSGDIQEYMVGDDHSGLTLIYDDSGNIGDYTAKFRPWEGGIDVSALMQYLVGFEPDRPARSLALRPHLPVNWPSFAVRGLRAGDDRFDVELGRDGSVTTVRVTSHAAEDYDLTLRWDASLDAALAVRLGGSALPEADLERFEHFGQQSVRAAALRLPAGGAVDLAL